MQSYKDTLNRINCTHSVQSKLKIISLVYDEQERTWTCVWILSDGIVRKKLRNVSAFVLLVRNAAVEEQETCRSLQSSGTLLSIRDTTADSELKVGPSTAEETKQQSFTYQKNWQSIIDLQFNLYFYQYIHVGIYFFDGGSMCTFNIDRFVGFI